MTDLEKYVGVGELWLYLDKYMMLIYWEFFRIYLNFFWLITQYHPQSPLVFLRALLLGVL